MRIGDDAIAAAAPLRYGECATSVLPEFKLVADDTFNDWAAAKFSGRGFSRFNVGAGVVDDEDVCGAVLQDFGGESESCDVDTRGRTTETNSAWSFAIPFTGLLRFRETVWLRSVVSVCTVELLCVEDAETGRVGT